jgi:hypothetical protein
MKHTPTDNNTSPTDEKLATAYEKEIIVECN